MRVRCCKRRDGHVRRLCGKVACRLGLRNFMRRDCHMRGLYRNVPYGEGEGLKTMGSSCEKATWEYPIG